MLSDVQTDISKPLPETAIMRGPYVNTGSRDVGALPSSTTTITNIESPRPVIAAQVLQVLLQLGCTQYHGIQSSPMLRKEMCAAGPDPAAGSYEVGKYSK